MADNEIIVKVPKRFGINVRQGFAFNMRMWTYLLDYTQLSLTDLGMLKERFIPVLYYCAAFTFDSWRGKNPKYTESDVVRWIENMPQKTAQKILNCFLESKIGGETLIDLITEGEETDNGEKKKVTSKTMMDYALGELNMSRDEFFSLSLGDYTRKCYGHIIREYNQLRKLRMIIGTMAGKDPRNIMPLPGDWEHVPLDTPEHREQVLKAFGVWQKWNGNKLVYGKDS